MQFLLLLFLIVFLTLAGIALFAGLSYGIGAYWNARSGINADAADGSPCAQCNADSEWYHALAGWQQNAAMAWWWINRIQCSRKGC